MMKRTLIALATVVVLSGCSDPNSAWLNKGYSVGLDRQGWINANTETQLGTAGHWLKSLQDKGWLKSPSITNDADLKSNATSLMNCINATLPVSNTKMNNIVADCVKVNGWMK